MAQVTRARLGRTPRCPTIRAASINFQTSTQKEIFSLCRPGGAIRATEPIVSCPSSTPALRTSYLGHQAAVLACVILRDQEGRLECATASLDKTMKYWRIEQRSTAAQPDDEDVKEPIISVQTLAEGPIFALAKDTYTQDRPLSVFCGTSDKDVVVWEPPSSSIVSREKIRLDKHSGWVRALAVQERWLFSCGCNQLVQWDLAWPQPRRVNEISLFTGDIQAIATTAGRVFVVCTKGILRAWAMDAQGMLSDAGEVQDAHSGRVRTLLARGDYLYSAGDDGTINCWRADTLELVKTVKNAHAGEKINCAAVTCEAVECPGYLYSGGSDKSVRVWTLPDLLPACAPLVHHNAPVRAISTSLHHVLSADADGVLAIWDVSTVLDSYQVEDDYLSPAAPGDGSAV